ncbi:nucleotidyltransferase family protein [Tritonibacter scottomollicae]|uniref:Nucleotidyltransferase family protein n=1 Tax=Tritonibacter scottomollicae TaxID=483013 RepID=A0A2T0ZWG7_TRISK|nr:nucleotidyltransferase family protein [Tritonibacter scottomollicae]PRZ40699.1 hypothetical protein CLV89_1601 [Tritonibacter scottomollicae]
MDSDEFALIVEGNPTNRAILERLTDTGLRDVWLVSGCLFQTVWNSRTGRSPHYGIKDYDLFYFNDDDLSWEAEDTAIRQAMRAFEGLDAEIEIRNQARVHLWYPQKFGMPYDPLRRATDGIDRFLATACMFGVSGSANGVANVYAPKGFADLEGLVIRPNSLTNFDAETYRNKALRWQKLWPELRVESVD